MAHESWVIEFDIISSIDFPASSQHLKFSEISGSPKIFLDKSRDCHGKLGLLSFKKLVQRGTVSWKQNPESEYVSKLKGPVS